VTDPVGARPFEDGPAADEGGHPPAAEPAVEAVAAEPAATGAGEPLAGEPASGPTGHPAVDATVARLAEQADLPPAEQVAGYEAAQRALHQTLASIDQT
jgi:hypothetical protein